MTESFTPFPQELKVRPFRKRQRRAYLPLLVVAAAIGVIGFWVKVANRKPPAYQAATASRPAKASDMLAIKDWKPVAGVIDTKDSTLNFTYGDFDRAVALKGKFDIDGQFRLWSGQTFYRVQIPLYNRLKHAVIDGKDAGDTVTLLKGDPTPLHNYRNTTATPQNAEEAKKANLWIMASGWIVPRAPRSSLSFPVTPVAEGGPRLCEGKAISVLAILRQPRYPYYWINCGPPRILGQGSRLEEQAILDGRLIADSREIGVNVTVETDQREN